MTCCMTIDATSTNSLDDTRHDQHIHAFGTAAEATPKYEYDGSNIEHGTVAEYGAQFRVDRQYQSKRDKETGSKPC